jgi:hypothetical protein
VLARLFIRRVDDESIYRCATGLGLRAHNLGARGL